MSGRFYQFLLGSIFGLYSSAVAAIEYNKSILPQSRLDSSSSHCRLAAELKADTALSFSVGSDSWSGTGTIECHSALSSHRKSVNVCYISWYSKTFEHIHLDQIRITSHYLTLSGGDQDLLSEFEIKKVSEFMEIEDNSSVLGAKVLAWPGIKNYPMRLKVPIEFKGSKAFEEGALSIVKADASCSGGSN